MPRGSREDQGLRSSFCFVFPTGPPVIVVPPNNSTVNASQDVSLACQAEAYPANLTYSWFQDGINVFHIR